MTLPTRTFDVHLRDPEHAKRLKDPTHPGGRFHMEVYLAFSEAALLDRGNANVRPPSTRKKPYRDMLDTVRDDPASFHVLNRGITYLCDRFELDTAHRVIRITNPSLVEEEQAQNGGVTPADVRRFGIGDGGHTYAVIQETVNRLNEHKELDGWVEPYVRVRFMAGEAIESGDVEEIVEALNTSSQVQQYTIEEYQHQFDELKDALQAAGFDTSLVAFRENEELEWDVREIVQRMACFLKERWTTAQPTQMYRSKGRALDLYTNDETRDEFRRLYTVIADVVTLPEFLQAEFSRGEAIKGKRYGGLRAVRTLKKPKTRPGTPYQTDHELDLAAALPLAAAFRELLELRGDRYYWRLDPKDVFHRAAEELYKALVAKSRTARSVNALAQDDELWLQAANIVLRTKDAMLGERRTR
jgi:hypothetical protein